MKYMYVHGRFIIHSPCEREGVATLGSTPPALRSYNYIRKYGSTFCIGIAMVVLPYFGPWEN